MTSLWCHITGQYIEIQTVTQSVRSHTKHKSQIYYANCDIICELKQKDGPYYLCLSQGSDPSKDAVYVAMVTKNLGIGWALKNLPFQAFVALAKKAAFPLKWDRLVTTQHNRSSNAAFKGCGPKLFHTWDCYKFEPFPHHVKFWGNKTDKTMFKI